VIRRGVHAALEREANKLIQQSLKGITKFSEKADVLTPWKNNKRNKLREVFVPSGTPDPSHRKGMYHRAMNITRPELNSRDGHVPAQPPGKIREGFVLGTRDPSQNRRTGGLLDFVYGDDN
jgi:hypothetical protein